MINGFAAEQVLFKLITNSKKIKSFQLPSSEKLIKIASQSQLGRNRIQAAYPYLLSEFGVNYRNTKNNRLTQVIEGNLVPNTVILDYIFGIDTVVNILGYVIAIDVTVNPNKIEEKQAKLTLLKPLWQQVGIDKACVCHLKHQSPLSLWTSLKKVTKQSKVSAIFV